MFERPVVVVQNKKRVRLIVALLVLCLLIIVFFQLFTGCTYQSTTFKKFFCQPKIFSAQEQIPSFFVETDIHTNNSFEYRGETPALTDIKPYLMEVIGTQPSFVWLKAGALVYFGDITLKCMAETTIPTYFTLPVWGTIVDRLTSNVSITSIYGFNNGTDHSSFVVYADGTIKRYPWLNEFNEFVQDFYMSNMNNWFPLRTTYFCTNCFASEARFKFSDFWKLLVGVSSLIGACMALIGWCLIDIVDYQQIQKPDDEDIPLTNRH